MGVFLAWSVCPEILLLNNNVIAQVHKNRGQ